MTVALPLVITASLLAAASDLRTRRIPNWIAGALFACGLAASAFGGWQSLGWDLAITLAVLIAGTFAFSLKLIGGGDVKLLAAAAGTLGYPAAPYFVLFTLVCGGVIAVAYAAVRGRLGTALTNVHAAALPVFAGARPSRPQGSLAMPYALAILAGALCTALAAANNFVPHLRTL